MHSPTRTIAAITRIQAYSRTTMKLARLALRPHIVLSRSLIHAYSSPPSRSFVTSMSSVSQVDEELRSLPSPTALQQASYYACSVDFERLDGEQIHHTVRALADSLACALAAVTNPEIARIRDFAAKHSDATRSSLIWGTNLTCAPAYAALINSAAIRCLDANDLYLPKPPLSVLSAGHCSDALGGVLTLADPNVNTGQEILKAVMVAYEVQVALSSTMAWLERGLHSVSQINFAVPAAAAVFPQYRLTPTQVWNAMSLSATTGLCAQTWLKQGFKAKKAAGAAGASAPSPLTVAAASTSTAAVTAKSNDAVPSVKFVSVGLAAQRGVDSLELAQLGMTANSDSLETMLRFFDEPDRDLHLDAFGSLGHEGKGTMHQHLIKQYAAQFNLQAPISCALDLHAQGVRASDLESLEVHGHRFVCADVQGAPEAFAPQSQGSADHSTPYVIWAALQYGTFTPALAYADQAWLREDVRCVLRRMKLHVVEEFEKPRAEKAQLGCRLTATLKDGRTVTAQRLKTAGHPDFPLTDEELLSKMSALLAPSYGEGLAKKLWQACLALVESKDTSATKELYKLLATAPIVSSSKL